MSSDPKPVMRPMVRWYDPPVLVLAAWRDIVSQLFGQYADRRGVEAVSGPDEASALDPAYDYCERRDANGDLWFDYTADTGDGWNPTASVAHILAEPCVVMEDGTPLPRGRFLVLGGDEVYPVASRDGYRERLSGPFAAALPEGSADPEPDIYAVPGNHDWYDGLGSFLGLFAARQPTRRPTEPERRGRVIGGWRTQQTRSYFALRLARDLWLWGMDTQLEAYIDGAQIDYFTRVAARLMTPNSRVILALPQPSWMSSDGSPSGSLKNFLFVRRSLIKAMGHRLVLALSGDVHFFSCYRDEETLYVTAGGGGAFTSATHLIPQQLRMDDAQGEAIVLTEVCPPSPDRAQSRRLLLGILLMPFINWRLTVVLAVISALVAWGLDGAAPDPRKGLDGGLFTTLDALYRSPFAAVIVAALGLGLAAFASRRARKPWLGAMHGALQITALLAIVTLTGGWFDARIGRILAAGAIGGTVIAAVFGAYLYVSARFLRCHADDAFTGLSLDKYKAFLRLRVDAADRISLWGVGMPRSCRRWRFGRTPAGAWTAAPEEPIALKRLLTVELGA